MQFEFNLAPNEVSANGQFLALNGRRFPLVLVRNQRARKYWLRIRPDGSARVTIPRYGSIAEARRFVERNKRWLERELARLATRPQRPREWRLGTEIFIRGEQLKIEAGVNGETGLIRCGGEKIFAPDMAVDLRPLVEEHLRQLAEKELPARLIELGSLHQLPVRRITIRNQRTRWGSCSHNGTISLNWRLIQAPPFVRDYICLHELAHLRQLNHSSRFWQEVERMCPGYKAAEHWLKQHTLLRD